MRPALRVTSAVPNMRTHSAAYVLPKITPPRRAPTGVRRVSGRRRMPARAAVVKFTDWNRCGRVIIDM